MQNLAKNKGIILIHGLTSTPKAMAELEAFLSNQGFTTKVSCLPGHATKPEDLIDKTYKDWVEEVENDLLTFTNQVENVYLLGYCLGGNIALHLANQHPEDIAGIISMATPVWLRRHYYVKTFLPLMRRIKKFYHKPGISTEEFIQYYQETGAYTVIPYNSIYETLKLMALMKSQLNTIDKPILIVQSTIDPTVHHKSAYYIYDKIATPKEKKKLIMVEEKNHVPAGEVKSKEMVFREIVKFLKQEF